MQKRINEIRGRIESVCDSVARDPATVTLIAVSKTVKVDDIRRAYDFGIRHFGESRLQEALPKIEALPNDIIWHFIGKLQSNKAKRASQLFDVIHTLESESQLGEIEKGGLIEGFVEVNVGKEEQKSGLFPQEVPPFVKKVLQCKNVSFRGLMAIGPANLNAEFMRPYFQRMRELNEEMGGECLSMGMSGDFEVAIQEGATHVRVGSALFGERN